MNELALFAGAGGGILGGKLLGWKTICAVEINSYCARRLMQRQNEGHLSPFPIWDDVRTFDGCQWNGLVDVVSGGFPCQDISAAGKGAGITGKKSGLWKEMFRIICEIRPRYAIVENSPYLTKRGIDAVLGNLASMGYSGKWGVLGADDAGAPHIRKRIWIIAYSNGKSTYGATFNARKEKTLSQFERNGTAQSMANSTSAVGEWIRTEQSRTQDRSANTSWWQVEPEMDRVVNGMANRLDQLRALGNGQVPAVVRLAWEILTQ